MAEIIVTVADPVTEITATDETVVEVAVTEQVIAVEVGTSGPQGPAGPSPSPEMFSFVHIQSIASDEWVIVHNLDFHPNVTVIDSGGTQVEGDIAYTSTNSLTLTFVAAFAGTAYLS